MAQKILVVDDEPGVVRIITARLQADGYEVGAASNGREALKQVESTQPDLIVLDLNMPELSGWQVAHQLKSDARYKQTPILMLSALVDDDGPSGEMDPGDFMMGKPFQLPALSQTVRDLLRGQDVPARN